MTTISNHNRNRNRGEREEFRIVETRRRKQQGEPRGSSLTEVRGSVENHPSKVSPVLSRGCPQASAFGPRVQEPERTFSGHDVIEESEHEPAGPNMVSPL